NNKFIEILRGGYLILSDINQNITNYETSNFYLKSYLKLSDSLRTVKKANLSPETHIQFMMNDQINNNTKTEEEVNESNSKNDIGTLISILSVALITILS